MDRTLESEVDSAGTRLDSYIAERCGISRAYAQKLIQDGQVRVNGEAAKSSHRLNAGDRVTASVPPPSPTSLAPEDIPLEVVYEDSDLVVVDKPAGMVVHPAGGQYTGTLVNALIARCPDLRGIKGTSARASCTVWTRTHPGSW